MNALDLFYLPAAVLSAPWWASKTRGGWRERFGHTPSLPPPLPGSPRLLLHAVSVGEVNTLRQLVPLLRREGIDVVISSTTDTGLARAQALYSDADPTRIVRYPLDLSSSVERFLDAIRPTAVALVELEIWPNFVRECKDRAIPTAIINGRLSARSFKGYSRFARFLSPSFRRLSFAAVQDQSYADRFMAMGLPRERCHITGSMKWDAVTSPTSATLPPDALRLAAELGIDRARPLIVAGSTAPTGTSCEEALLHAACPPGVQLLCAPRKPEHFERAFAALGGADRCIRRSFKRPAALGAGADRFLLDTLGELRAAYSLADLAVVGRSFGDLRGSDPIEPIALGKPTIIGPAYANFEYIVSRFLAQHAIKVAPERTLATTLADLLNAPTEQARMIAAGHNCIHTERGASARHARMLTDLLTKLA